MEILKAIYFDPKHPIAYAESDKIYRWFKDNGYTLSRSKINNGYSNKRITPFTNNPDDNSREGESFPLIRNT